MVASRPSGGGGCDAPRPPPPALCSCARTTSHASSSVSTSHCVEGRVRRTGKGGGGVRQVWGSHSLHARRALPSQRRRLQNLPLPHLLACHTSISALPPLARRLSTATYLLPLQITAPSPSAPLPAPARQRRKGAAWQSARAHQAVAGEHHKGVSRPQLLLRHVGRGGDKVQRLLKVNVAKRPAARTIQCVAALAQRGTRFQTR